MTAPRFRSAHTFADSVLSLQSGRDASDGDMTPYGFSPSEHGAAPRGGAG